MTRTKYFTGEATGGSTGEASAEEMMRGYSDAGANPMADDGDFAFFMPQDGGGGFLGRAKGWER